MDVYLTEVGKSTSSLRFPCPPEAIKCNGSSRYRNYDLIKLGTVKIPKGSEVTTISWSGIFFGKERKKSEFMKIWVWKSPKSCKDILTRWRDKGTVLRLLATGTSINYDVTIETFDYEEKGAHGDYYYSISFVVERDVKIYTTSEMKIEAFKVPQTVSRPAPAKNETYKVVKGDNLWSIAQKKLGNGTRWKEIYNLNKDIIEKSAKRYGRSSSSNGHWIYPGDVYTLPAK